MKKLTILILLLFPVLGHTQGIGLWAGAGVEKKLNSSFSLNLNGQARLTDNASSLKTYLGEAGVEYKLNKFFGASVYYRYIAKRKYEKNDVDFYYRSFHRFYGNVTFEYRFAKWLKFDYRFRYQNQFKDDSEGITNSGSYFRHKFELTYKNKSRFEPYVASDVFYLLGSGFDQMRVKAGCNISLNQRNAFDISVFQDKSLVGGGSEPLVVGVGYKLKLKSKKGKKDKA